MNDLLLADFLSFRGRADRRGLAVLAAIMVGAQIGIYGALSVLGHDLDSSATWLFHILFLWVASAGITKRLHDFGYSGWSLMWAMAATVVWTFGVSLAAVLTFGESAGLPGTTGFAITISGAMLPVVLATIWLHLAKGELVDNRYGPAPGATGFSMPKRHAGVDATSAQTAGAAA
ncbi:MAG: DUF805 domain-containing protein [Hyphomicrobium sp.]